MTEIGNCIYIRHGITRWSIENRFTGQCDVPLIGVDDKQLIHSFDLVNRVEPTILIHSPLLRAVQTAALFRQQFNFQKIICDPILTERNFGRFEGLTKSAENREKLESEPTAESMVLFRQRVKIFIDRYERYREDLLVVGHSAFFTQMAQIRFLDKQKLKCCEACHFKW